MAAADQRDKHLLDQFFMTDDDACDLRFYLGVGAPRAVDALLDIPKRFHDAAPRSVVSGQLPVAR